MLKQIDKTNSIMIEKILGISIEYCPETEVFNVLFGQELAQNQVAKNLERGWSYYKGIVACVNFKTMEEAHSYAKKIMNTDNDWDYNDYEKARDGQDSN